MTLTCERFRLDLACLVRDPPEYLPRYWRPVEPPPCSQAVLRRVLFCLRNLDQHTVPERR